jgi:hypothetical protein
MTIGDKLNTTAATISRETTAVSGGGRKLRRLAPGDCVAVLGDVVQPGKGSREVSSEGQFPVGVADAQDPQHAAARGDHPINITPGAVHADVVQGCETLASEEVDTCQIEYQLLGDARVSLDEPTERMAIGGVDVSSDGDEYAAVAHLLRSEDRSAVALHFIGGWQMHVVQLNRTGSGQGELLPQRTSERSRDSRALRSEGLVSGAAKSCTATGCKLNRYRGYYGIRKIGQTS